MNVNGLTATDCCDYIRVTVHFTMAHTGTIGSNSGNYNNCKISQHKVTKILVSSPILPAPHSIHGCGAMTIGVGHALRERSLYR